MGDWKERRGTGAHASTSSRSNLEDARPEEKRDELPYRAHMLAGAAAGIAEHLAMYPVDTIKTRMQALAHPGQRLHGYAVKAAVKAVLRREGFRGLYGGFWAVAWSAGPAHALYFATFEAMKEQLGGNLPGHHPLTIAAAGSMATILSDGIMTPADVIKQRLQVARSPYKGILDCAQSIMRNEGFGTLFKSYRTTLLMNIPSAAIHFATYESAKKFIVGHKEEDLMVHLIAGGLAGAAAAAATNPLDVVKTRLQLEGVNSATRYGTTAVVPMLRRIAQEEGSRAVWKGVQARMLFHLPASAICWGVYETAKRMMRESTSQSDSVLLDGRG